eukprot:TRINITY_DN2176_c0_g1_i1.p1 TRINITY_DN2176_c0_g1~~TRINITY_DN2176_c0_g1_i1.p1  ORF type:complete len:300 (+),score=71.26 TRINITY_DN2176_c0_g1_i1:153-1052(+)
MSFVLRKTLRRGSTADSVLSQNLKLGGEGEMKSKTKTPKLYKSTSDLSKSSTTSSDFSELNEGTDLSDSLGSISPQIERDGEDLKQKELAMAVTFLCDISGSMPTNGKLEYVTLGFKETFEGLRERDLIQLYTFGSCSAARQFARSKHNITAAKFNIKPTLMGGGTPLWDSLQLVIKEFPSVKNWMQKEFVIVTNGPDNCSKVSFSDVQKSIEETKMKSFHVTFLNIGESTKEIQQIKAFCEDKSNTSFTFLTCNGTKEGILEQFTTIQHQIKSRRGVTMQPAIKKKEPQKKIKRLLEM